MSKFVRSFMLNIDIVNDIMSVTIYVNTLWGLMPGICKCFLRRLLKDEILQRIIGNLEKMNKELSKWLEFVCCNWTSGSLELRVSDPPGGRGDRYRQCRKGSFTDSNLVYSLKSSVAAMLIFKKGKC